MSGTEKGKLNIILNLNTFLFSSYTPHLLKMLISQVSIQ